MAGGGSGGHEELEAVGEELGAGDFEVGGEVVVFAFPAGDGHGGDAPEFAGAGIGKAQDPEDVADLFDQVGGENRSPAASGRGSLIPPVAHDLSRPPPP